MDAKHMMQDSARFDRCGWLVRIVSGKVRAPCRIPGVVEPRIWRFKNGVSVRNQSLTEALELANKIMRRRERENSHST
jgi:hypothetical protein